MPIPKVVPEIKTEVNTELSLRFSTYVKNAFVLALQEAFAHPATPLEYRYYKPSNPADQILTATVTGAREASRKSQVSIYRGWPNKDIKFPCIIVETEPGNASITSLGEEIQREVLADDGKTVLGVVYSGNMWIPVKITVYADTPVDRERLTDLVTIFVRYVFKDFFWRQQIPYLDIQAGEDGEEDVPGVGSMFVGSVRLQCQTEFDQFIDQSLIAAVESIDIKGAQFGTDAADMQSNNTP